MIPVKMNTCMAGPNHAWNAGDTINLDEAEASRFVARGFASLVDPTQADKLHPDPFGEKAAAEAAKVQLPDAVVVVNESPSYAGDSEEDDSDALTGPAEATAGSPKPDGIAEGQGEGPSEEVTDGLKNRPTAEKRNSAAQFVKKIMPNSAALFIEQFDGILFASPGLP